METKNLTENEGLVLDKILSVFERFRFCILDDETFSEATGIPEEEIAGILKSLHESNEIFVHPPNPKWPDTCPGGNRMIIAHDDPNADPSMDAPMNPLWYVTKEREEALAHGKDQPFHLIGTDIRHDRRLTPIAKLVYIEIHTTSGTYPCHYPSEYFEAVCMRTEEEIERAFDLLHKAGHIYRYTPQDGSKPFVGTTQGLIMRLQQYKDGTTKEDSDQFDLARYMLYYESYCHPEQFMPEGFVRYYPDA